MREPAGRGKEEKPLNLDRVRWHRIMEDVERETFASEPERVERRRTVRAALKSLMPWNDADFSRINVPSTCPFECRTAGEWERMLAENLGATARICIGRATFWCIPQLLRLHSSYFYRELRPVNSFRPGQDLWATGFRAAYDWMRLQAPLDEDSPPAGIVELLHTAQQLEMDALELLCHRYLCSDRFRERTAYEVYLRARPYPQFHSLRRLMLQRLGFHFLAVVGGYEYLEMPPDDLMAMLQEDSLGVNSEVEVLYGLMRWMAADTAKRAPLLPVLLRCVRFTRVPMSLLCRLRAALEEQREELGEQEKAAGHLLNAMRNSKELAQRIREAISVLRLRSAFPQPRVFLAACRERGFAVEAPREWLYDESCPYHIPQPQAPYRHRVGSGQFLAYVMRRARSALDPSKELPNLRAVIPAEEDELDSIEDLLMEEEELAAVEAKAKPERNLVGLPSPNPVAIVVPRMESDSEPEEELDDTDEGTNLPAGKDVLQVNPLPKEAELEPVPEEQPKSSHQDRERLSLPLIIEGHEEQTPNIYRSLNSGGNYPNADNFMEYLDIVDGIGGFSSHNYPQWMTEDIVLPGSVEEPEDLRPFEAYINETDQVIKKLLDEIAEREKDKTD